MSVYAPTARLAPFVRRFTIVETESADATRVLLPEPGLVLGVRYAGAATQIDGEHAARVPDASITGVLGRARRMRTSARSGVVLASFRETGAARFFAEPLHELFGASTALDALVPRADLDRLAAQLAEARAHAQRVALLEQFLSARLRPQPPDRLVEHAVRAIDASGGAQRIDALARELGVGQDALEKRFRRVVGAPPKRLASLLRIRRVVDHATSDARRRGGWSRIALDSGYYDHAHLIREFRAVTGEPPARFFAGVDHC